MDPNPDNVVPPSIATTLSRARSAAASPSVKRFVYTSSSGAAATLKIAMPYEVKSDTYNEEAVAIAYSGKGSGGLAAMVVPNAALGQVFLPEHQGFPTAVGLLKVLWRGHVSPDFIAIFSAQWFCDVINIAALLLSDVESERLIAYAGRFNINDLSAIF